VIHRLPKSLKPLSDAVHSEKYYRMAGLAAIRWLVECRDGQLSVPAGRLFNVGFIDYSLDAERVLRKRLSHFEWNLLMAVHRNGYDAQDAVPALAILFLPESIWARIRSIAPDTIVQRVEAKLGRIIVDAQLTEPMR
jgi:hypothetical protein